MIMENKVTFDAVKAMKAQDKLCKENGYPHFAPSTGICWACHRNIYEQVGWKNEYLPGSKIPYRHIQVPLNSPELEFVSGISVVRAGKELVTGCPHCNSSYCE